MLDTGASANMMSLKVMQQLGLKVTRPYRKVCGFESKS
jgi:membrane carboxypeptidase/penicillin-binding protein